MSWAKLDDRFDSHPKVLRVWRQAPEAVGLWTLALTYTSRNELDGHVPADAVALWTGDGDRLAGALVDAGLWDVAEDGWQIHDFDVYNPTGQDRAAISKARAEAGRRGGIASGRARRAGQNGGSK